MAMATKPGFYDGKFRKAGQPVSDEAIEEAEKSASKKLPKKSDDK